MYASSLCTFHNTRWRLYPRCPEYGYPSRWRRTECDDGFGGDGGESARSSIPKLVSHLTPPSMQGLADSENFTGSASPASHERTCIDGDSLAINDRDNVSLKAQTDSRTAERVDQLAALYKAYRYYDGEAVSNGAATVHAAHPPPTKRSNEGDGGVTERRSGPMFPSPYVPLSRRGGGALRHKQIDRPLTAPSPRPFSACKEEVAKSIEITSRGNTASVQPAHSFYQRAQHVLLDAFDFALSSQVLLPDDEGRRRIAVTNDTRADTDCDAGRTVRTPKPPPAFGSFRTIDADAGMPTNSKAVLLRGAKDETQKRRAGAGEWLEQQEAKERDLLSSRLLSESLSSTIVPNFAAFELMARHVVVSTWMDRVENELHWRCEALCLEACEEHERARHVALALLSNVEVVEGLAEPCLRGAIVIEEEERRCELIRCVADRIINVFAGDKDLHSNPAVAVPLYKPHPSAAGELLTGLAKKALIDALLQQNAIEDNSGEFVDEVGSILVGGRTGSCPPARRESYRALLETLDGEDLANVQRALALSISKSTQENADQVYNQLLRNDQTVDGKKHVPIGKPRSLEEGERSSERDTREIATSIDQDHDHNAGADLPKQEADDRKAKLTASKQSVVCLNDDALAECDELEENEDGGERPNSADSAPAAYRKGSCRFEGNTDANATSIPSSPVSPSHASAPDPTFDLLPSAEADPDVESTPTQTKASMATSPKKARKRFGGHGSPSKEELTKEDVMELGEPEQCGSNFKRAGEAQTYAMRGFEGETWRDVEGSFPPHVTGLREIIAHSPDLSHPPSVIDMRDISSPRTVATKTSAKVGDAMSTAKPCKRGQGTENGESDAFTPASLSYRKQWCAYIATQSQEWLRSPVLVDEVGAKEPQHCLPPKNDALTCPAGREPSRGRSDAISVARSVCAGLHLAKARMAARRPCDTSTVLSEPLSDTRHGCSGHEEPYHRGQQKTMLSSASVSSRVVYIQAISRQHALRVEALKEAESIERQLIEEMEMSQVTTDPCALSCTCATLKS